MNSLRNLHSIGIDHSHDHLFDVDSFDYHNETDVALPPSTDDDINMAMEIENRNRAISMSIILSVLMLAYLSFCCLYQRKRELQRVSRDQLRNDNRAVLDESTDATSRALQDGEMSRKLEERKKKIW
jgi:heme exporter protein D